LLVLILDWHFSEKLLGFAKTEKFCQFCASQSTLCYSLVIVVGLYSLLVEFCIEIAKNHQNLPILDVNRAKSASKITPKKLNSSKNSLQKSKFPNICKN
jgi:hypothetical protein